MDKAGAAKLIWNGLQRQLDAKGLRVKRESIQDATFIEADPGSSKKLHGGDAKTSRFRDGAWAKKGSEIHFGYKLHSKVDMDYGLINGLIREIKTSTASLHDCKVDLFRPMKEK